MTGWPGQPAIYEVNTAVWLNELARTGGRRVTLADVTADGWDAATPAGVDAVWLMGVWERSPAGLALLPADAERAAAVTIATLPGATLWHEGQFEGRRVRPPVFLSRRPDEGPDLDLANWCRALLAAVAGHEVRAGQWRLLGAAGWPDNQSCRNLAAWSWAADPGGSRHVLVINLSAQPAQARIRLDLPDLPGRGWRLTDILSQAVFGRDGAELASPGLFVDLGPWRYHLLALQ